VPKKGQEKRKETKLGHDWAQHPNCRKEVSAGKVPTLVYYMWPRLVGVVKGLSANATKPIVPIPDH
jgi:hypothetical protein